MSSGPDDARATLLGCIALLFVALVLALLFLSLIGMV